MLISLTRNHSSYKQRAVLDPKLSQIVAKISIFALYLRNVVFSTFSWHIFWESIACTWLAEKCFDISCLSLNTFCFYSPTNERPETLKKLDDNLLLFLALIRRKKHFSEMSIEIWLSYDTGDAGNERILFAMRRFLPTVYNRLKAYSSLATI